MIFSSRNIDSTYYYNKQPKKCQIVRKVAKEIITYNDICDYLKIAKWG